ncbi:MAG TPA: hypothetical protein VH083_04040 [Myxococcales bacterium]|nr:hypothetical protein [Myxococcales bacterium]
MRLLLCLALLSCGTTGGALVTMPMSIKGVQGPLTFTTNTGWTVTLTTAKAALGPFYFNASPPDMQSFRNGTVLLEATEQVVVDALDPTPRAVTGGADGETGTAVSVEIDLFAQTPSFGTNNFGLVEGTASKDGVTVAFSGPLSIPALTDASLQTTQKPLLAQERIRGAAVSLNITPEPQSLLLQVDPTHWFDSVDFSQLAGGTWDLHSAILNALVQGVQQESGVYSFSLAAR